MGNGVDEVILYSISLREGPRLCSLTALFACSLCCFLPGASLVQGLSPLSSSSSPRSDFLLACPFLSFVGYLLLEGTRVLLNELPFKTFVSTKQVEKKKKPNKPKTLLR